MICPRSGSKFPWNPDFPRVFSTSFVLALVLSVVGVLSSTIAADAQTRLDNELVFQAARDAAVSRNTRAIVMLRPGAALPAEFAPYATRRLRIIDGYVVSVPNDVLARLAGNPAVTAIHTDRPADQVSTTGRR